MAPPMRRFLSHYFDVLFPKLRDYQTEADNCNSFQRLHVTQTPLPSPSYMHVFLTTVWQSSQIWPIRAASDRHTQLKTIPPCSYVVVVINLSVTLVQINSLMTLRLSDHQCHNIWRMSSHEQRTKRWSSSMAVVIVWCHLVTSDGPTGQMWVEGVRGRRRVIERARWAAVFSSVEPRYDVRRAAVKHWLEHVSQVTRIVRL